MADLTKAFDDSQHPVRFKSDLGDKLVVQSMAGEEELGRLFTFELQLLSHDTELHFDKIVGTNATVIVDTEIGERCFNGIITEFSYAGNTKKIAHYHAVLRPWLWFLSQKADSCIYQEMTVPDIIKKVFKNAGMADFTVSTSGQYRIWDYCVQYRESDFDFVSRLMEQEGIFYYFEHEESKHNLVMADDSTTSPGSITPGGITIPYNPPAGDKMMMTDHLDHWTTTQSIQPNQYGLKDFDFTKSKTDLTAKNQQSSKHSSPVAKLNIYDYPGEYSVRSDGENYAKIRLQELRCKHERVRGSGPCRYLSPGNSFQLEDYPRADQNKQYTVISISHQVNAPDYFSGDGGGGELYRCVIEAIDKLEFFRTERLTPKPIVRGPQTAIVVGPSGEEIHTDEHGHGRVKVQFHWDRVGELDADSSCFIRVSQLWAGKNWGAMHIPRIGQEVIVSFMEGDPDRPIITGRVYNDECKPPYDLPANKTVSGIKSRSTPDGSEDNRNELSFEDKSGEEKVFLHAEKDFEGIVKNTRYVDILGEEDGSPEKTIEALNIIGQRETYMEGNDLLILKEGGIGRKIEIKKGGYDLKVDQKAYTAEICKDITTTSGTGDITTTADSGNITTQAAMGNITTKADLGKITIDAMQEILLKVGASSIKIDNMGVTIKGPMIFIEADGMLDAKGSVTMIDGSGMTSITGGVVMIN
jgi:type VI secretion system secreted protein VgrG